MNAHLAHSRSFVLTLGLLTATAALTVDLSLPAIPSMVVALESTLTHGQQIVGIFMAGMAVGQIPAGLFSDRLGRLPTLYAGMSLFAIAATVAAASNEMEWLLAARFVQGIGAASAVVLSRAIVRDIASGQEAARLMSLMTMIFTAAPVIAPTVGALLVAQWGWRAPFIGIAACAYLLLIAIRQNLVETKTPEASEHPLRQLVSSFREFFSHRQSVFSLMLLLLLPAGFMSVITVSAALTVEIYGYSVQAYGLIFACAGLSILAGSALNRLLVARFDAFELIGLAVALIFVAGSQLAIIAWLDAAPFWWLWSSVCVFMFSVPILMSNAMVVALDPLPRIAGVASSIIGTLQNLAGASGALVGALNYDGTVRNTVVIIAIAALATTAIFLARPLISPPVPDCR
ncbi:MAG: multidrug effflux MFS transporter [Gammaproteobacteria bacterium]|nr:multidrug effflux MFS transporter [Gammaproteobacteria bacterium]